MIIGDIIGILGSVELIFNLNISNIIIGRLIVGIYCGISSSVIPSFLISISPI